MNNLQQIQTIAYSFLSAIVLFMVYAFINRLFYFLRNTIRRLFIQWMVMVGLGFLFYLGLVRINGGVLRYYMFVCFFLGYLFYQFYYASKWLVFLEYVMRVVKKIVKFISYPFYKILSLLRKISRRWKKKKKQQSETM